MRLCIILGSVQLNRLCTMVRTCCPPLYLGVVDQITGRAHSLVLSKPQAHSSYRMMLVATCRQAQCLRAGMAHFSEVSEKTTAFAYLYESNSFELALTFTRHFLINQCIGVMFSCCLQYFCTLRRFGIMGFGGGLMSAMIPTHKMAEAVENIPKAKRHRSTLQSLSPRNSSTRMMSVIQVMRGFFQH